MRNLNPLAAPLAWAVLYFLFGFASHELNGAFIASGFIWLPAGITVGALLLTPTARWFPLLVLLVAAQVLLGWLEQRELWRMLLFSLDEIGVAALAVWLVRRAPFPMQGLYFVRGLLLVGVGASMVSAIFGAVWFSATQGLSFWQTLRIWSLSDLVGILIMVPVLAGWSQFRATRSGGIARTEFLLGLASFGAMVVTTWLAFDSDLDRFILDINFSTTYLPLVFVALVTLLWGGRGGALAVVVLSLMAFVYNSLGRGPFAELVQLHASNALLEMQVYLAVASLLSLLVSALKTTREQLHEQASHWQNEVALSLEASGQLAFMFDVQRQCFTWRGDVEALLGCAPQQLVSLDQVLRLVAPLDQARLRQRWLDDAEGDARADMRIRLASGVEVLDMSRAVLDAEDRLALVSGMWRLVVPQVQEVQGTWSA